MARTPQKSSRTRTQGAVLLFFAAAWVSLAVLYVAYPDVYEQAQRSPPGSDPRLGTLAFAVVTALVLVLSVGVVRRWRLVYWLTLVAFLAGILRAVTSALVFAGVVAASTPTWYSIFQDVIGVVQVAIGPLMLRGIAAPACGERFRRIAGCLGWLNLDDQAQHESSGNGFGGSGITRLAAVGDDVDVDVTGQAQQFLDDRAAEKLMQTAMP